MKFKIPNYLTIGRIIIVPIFVFAYYLPGFYGDVIPFALFVLASFTDFLDGLLARMYKEESKLGELLDPIADKIIVAIAKGKMRNSGNETFFHNGKEFKFEKNDPTLFFLQRLRDESHRFAISAHRAKRKKGISKSLLDQIDGIGSIRKRALLNHFGSARAVESASLDEIKSVDGVEEKVAKKIYNFFHE